MTNIQGSVATILERELTPTIERWIERVHGVPSLAAIPLDYKQRTGHLPQLIKDLIARLRMDQGVPRPETQSAHDHGRVRFKQGYQVPLLVEESRLLQVSLFETLRLNQSELEPGKMMEGVMIIADECDAQLKHSVETFMSLEENQGLAIV